MATSDYVPNLRCRFCGRLIEDADVGTCAVCDAKYDEPTRRADGKQMILETIEAIKQAAITAHNTAAKVFAVAFSNIHTFDNAKWSKLAYEAGQLRDELKDEYEDAVRLYNREGKLEGDNRLRRDMAAIFYTSWQGPSTED